MNSFDLLLDFDFRTTSWPSAFAIVAAPRSWRAPKCEGRARSRVGARGAARGPPTPIPAALVRHRALLQRHARGESQTGWGFYGPGRRAFKDEGF
eukprot:1505707-Pleurochrysis_carterae.AAC.1